MLETIINNLSSYYIMNGITSLELNNVGTEITAIYRKPSVFRLIFYYFVIIRVAFLFSNL